MYKRPETFEECADCLLEILNALRIEKCLFVGNSWGAILAGLFGARHPERLSGAVAANGTAAPATLLERLQMKPLIAFVGMHREVPEWFATVTRKTFEGETAAKTKPAFGEFIRRVLQENPQSIAF